MQYIVLGVEEDRPVSIPLVFRTVFLNPVSVIKVISKVETKWNDII